MSACQKNDVQQLQIDAANSSQLESQSSEQSNISSEAEKKSTHTLNEFIEIDADNVSDFEHATISNGPSTVEFVTKFTQQEAKDMAKQLSQLVVINEGNIADHTAVGGSIIRYTLNFTNVTEPLVIYYSGTFAEGSNSNPTCYIDRDYYKDVVQSPNIVDVVFPENYETLVYDIIDGKRAERTK